MSLAGKWRDRTRRFSNGAETLRSSSCRRGAFTAPRSRFPAAVTVNGRSLPALLAAPYRAGRCVAGEAQFAAMKAMQPYQGWERATEMPRTSLGHLPDTAQ